MLRSLINIIFCTVIEKNQIKYLIRTIGNRSIIIFLRELRSCILSAELNDENSIPQPK